MNNEKLERWPEYVRLVFAAIGEVMSSKRLAPEMLSLIPIDRGSVVPDHVVTISHVTGKEARRRRGYFVVTITEPQINGRWRFWSGQLETLARL